ncbi:DinB family protein [Pontibacter sp. MBLB2868]|uniref:DinB family protein n=1 Tax=Pontibacter sp. MBLB2868 TaxID=3451555 RepID=UPI003F754AD2
MEQEQQLREQLVKMMRGGIAFRPREELLEGITLADAGKKVESLPYTIWQLLDHLRFAQHDILDFCRNPDYQEPTWPDDYWPKETAPKNKESLQHTINALAHDLDEMVKLVQDKSNDLFAPIPQGNGQTLLREAILVAEHNAYHLGEVVVLRRLINSF